MALIDLGPIVALDLANQSGVYFDYTAHPENISLKQLSDLTVSVVANRHLRQGQSVEYYAQPNVPPPTALLAADFMGCVATQFVDHCQRQRLSSGDWWASFFATGIPAEPGNFWGYIGSTNAAIPVKIFEQIVARTAGAFEQYPVNTAPLIHLISGGFKADNK